MKKVIKVIFPLLIISIVGVVYYNLTQHTKLNYFVASKIYQAPANSAFTDDSFYKCVVDAYNEENGTSIAYTDNLTDEQLSTITHIDCNEKNIKTVDGIEKLISLTHLYLADNDISNLNVSKNIELTNIFVPGNNISEIDISKNTKLIDLHVYSNKLTEIDVSNNPNLELLSIGVDNQPATNKIKNIDLSNNIKLEILALNDLGLNSLDVSKNTLLKELIVSGNNLTSLDITNNQFLTRLEVSQNQLTSLNINDKSVLKTLMLESNQLTNLDLSNNENIEYVSVAGNNIDQIKFGNNNKLTYLDVGEYARYTNGASASNSGNKITELDLSSLISLKELYVDNNQLSSLDLSENLELNYLSAENNQLESINITNNKLLEQIVLNNNSLSNIDINNNILLSRVFLKNNKLTSINLSNNELIETLNLESNNLINLDVSQNTILKYLYVGSHSILFSNQLTNLDVSNNPHLIILDLYGNRLTSLDVSKNTKLQELKLDWNKITSLNLSNNLELKYLSTELTDINELDISKNPLLKSLDILRTPFKKTLGVYKNNDLDLINNIPVKFPLDTSCFLKSLNNYQDNLIENNIKFSEAGIHNLSVTYNHNIYPYSNPHGLNVFDVDYTIHVIEATSDKYEINAEEGYIYTKTDTDSKTILSNINLNYGEAIIEDNKLSVKYENEIIKIFALVNISSLDYDLSKEYIYIGLNELNLDNINLLNGTSIIEDNKLKIQYNDKILQEYLLISNSSQLYKFVDNNLYIGTNIFDIEKVNVINGNKEFKDDQLLIKYKEDLLNEYSILTVNFGELKIFNKKIAVIEETTYEDFISNITTNGVIYKIFNGEEEVTNGNIIPSMKLKVYIGEEIVDTYEITDEYLEISDNLNVNETTGMIEDLIVGQTVEDLMSNIDTTGTLKIVDQDDNEITDVVGTGYKLVIELSKETIEYTLVVNGDITGDGEIKMSDVMKAANQVLDEDTIVGDCYLKAADVTGDGKIKMSDVMKLANYIIEGGSL